MADIRIKDLATTATSSASDDYLALDGSTNGTRKILATNVANNVTDVIFGTSGPSAKSSIAARAARQGLVFDGTTRASYSIPAFGTGDFTASIWINQATLSNSAAISGPVNAFQLSLNRLGNGYLTVTNSGVGHVLDVNASASIQVGKFQLISCVRSSGTATFYVNGISVGSGAVATDFSAGCIYVGGALATAFVTGTISPLIYNRALSAAEVVSLYEAGMPAGADYAGTGAGTTLNTSAFVQEAGLNFDSFSGASSSGFTAGATTTSGARIIQSRTAFAIKKGDTIRFSFTATQNSGTIGAIYLALRTASGSTISAVTASIVAGSNTYSLTATSAASDATVSFIRGNGGSVVDFTISSFTATPLGLLLAPDAAQSGGGLTWYDTSGNAANITLPASGVSWNVPTSGNVTSSSSLNLRAGGTNQDITLTPTGLGGVNVSSTVRATGLQGGTFTGSGVELGFTSGAGNLFAYNRTSSTALPLILQSPGGNVLIGTTVDSGARLQLATHTTSAGGIGFGTDTSFFRNAQGRLTVGRNDGTNAAYLRFAYNTSTSAVESGSIGAQNTVLYIDSLESGGSTQLRTNGSTTALTLDSSQNATFAGRAAINGNYATVATGNFTLSLGNFSAGTRANAGLRTDSVGDLDISAGSGGQLSLCYDTSVPVACFGNFSIASGKTLKLGNAYVAGAVVATGYVTIQDSTGTTYRVPVLV